MFSAEIPHQTASLKTLTAIIESLTYKIESNRIILKNIIIFAKWKTMFITSKLI